MHTQVDRAVWKRCTDNCFRNILNIHDLYLSFTGTNVNVNQPFLYLLMFHFHSQKMQWFA